MARSSPTASTYPTRPLEEARRGREVWGTAAAGSPGTAMPTLPPGACRGPRGRAGRHGKSPSQCFTNICGVQQLQQRRGEPRRGWGSIRRPALPRQHPPPSGKAARGQPLTLSACEEKRGLQPRRPPATHSDPPEASGGCRLSRAGGGSAEDVCTCALLRISASLSLGGVIRDPAAQGGRELSYFRPAAARDGVSYPTRITSSSSPSGKLQLTA